ncbi:MAG: PAS domain S-box protein, partial [Gammaproteobacteria bacterium]|nr:PAS domain S-box protein [Gammaproteobacteria bacterium]
IIDSHTGVIEQSTIPQIIGRDRSNASYFLEAQNMPDRSLLFLGKPIEGILGTYIMFLNKAIPDKNGNLKWLAVSTINLEYIDSILKALLTTETQKIQLINGDGSILSDSSMVNSNRLTQVNNHYIRDLLNLNQHIEPITSIIKTQNGHYHITATDIIPEYIPASNRIIVSISEDSQIIFKDWFYNNSIYVLTWLLVSILILYLVHLHDKHESSLLINEERFKDFTDTASDWVWEMDKNLRFTYVSDLFFTIANIKAEDIIGKTRWEYVTDKSIGIPNETWGKHRQIMESHKPFRDFRYDVTDADNKTYRVSLNGKPVFNRRGNFIGYRGTGSDVTQLENALSEAKHAQQEAESANKAKSQFLSSMSHELRTPLNVILGYAQLLNVEVSDPDQKDSIESMLKSGWHLLELINDVLDLSKIESGQMEFTIESINIINLLEECCNLCQPLSNDRDITISCKTQKASSPPIFALADYTKLKQCILNYLSNAIKYGRSNGHVKINYQDCGNMIRVSVIDDGDGIPSDKLKQLFIPFSRLNYENSNILGAGLGLSITKEIIESMEGNVGAISEVGTGSTFWLEIPKANT